MILPRPAIRQARALAAEVGLAGSSRFIETNVYELKHILPEPESFDVVYTTWGTIGWLPDVKEWAKLIAWYLKPGGRLYFADGHPTAFVFDDASGALEMTYPYDTDGVADVVESGETYAAEGVETHNTKTFEWMHPLSDTVGALLDVGLRLDFLHEHYEVPWRMFAELEPTAERMFAWPDKKWLPLAVSIAATRN